MKTINNFWNYFKENNFVFLLINEISREEASDNFEKLITVLKLYNRDLNLIVKNGKNKSSLIITADGNPFLFKEVELLVHHAPDIKRWKISAFIQPDEDLEKYMEGRDAPMIYYGMSLKISEMYFMELQDVKRPQDMSIRIYLKNYIIYKDNPRLREAVYVCIEHLMGEKAFANDIKFIQIKQLTSYEDLLEVYHLPIFIETLKIEKLKIKI